MTAPAVQGRRRSIVRTMLWCFTVVALLTVAASAIASFLFAGVRSNLAEIGDRSLPAILASFSLVQETTDLLADVRQLAEAPDLEDLERAGAAALDRLASVDRIAGTMSEDHELGGMLQELRETIERLAADAALKIEAQQRREALVTALEREHQAFIAAVEPIIERERSAAFSAAEAAASDSITQIDYLIDENFEALRAVLGIEADMAEMRPMLERALTETGPDTLARLRLDLVGPIAAVEGRFGQLSAFEGAAELSRTVSDVVGIAFGEGNIFSLAAAGDEAALRETASRLTEAFDRFAVESEALLREVDAIVLQANSRAVIEGRALVEGADERLGTLYALLLLFSDVNFHFGLMGVAASADSRGELAGIEERRTAILDDIALHLESLGDAPAREAVAGLIDGALAFGDGDGSIFAARAREISARIDARLHDHESEELTSLMVYTARAMAIDLGRGSVSAVDQTRALLVRAETILTALAILSFVLVAFILWFYVYRLIAARLQHISKEMLALADGHIDGEIAPPRRNDEIGDMRQTLKVFQANAIERRRAERALTEAKDRAEAALEALQATQARLVHAEKMASLGQLTAGVAHEIKNPLNFVNNFARLSRELIDEFMEVARGGIGQLPAEDREDAEELAEMISSNLDKIRHHGNRADAIVRNMLLHSRSDGGEAETAGVNALIEEALGLSELAARGEAQRAPVTIEKTLDPAAGEILCVRPDLVRVLINLVSNAVYAARQGGERGRAPTVTVSSRDLGGKVAIEVCDNGPGISADKLSRIFEPFFTTKPTTEGTGLGLSLSHTIVTEQHGGTLEVESEPDVRTCFRATLPRSGAPG